MRQHRGPEAAPQLQQQLARSFLREISFQSVAPGLQFILAPGAIAALLEADQAACDLVLIYGRLGAGFRRNLDTTVL